MRLRTITLAAVLLTLAALPGAALAAAASQAEAPGDSNVEFLLAGSLLVWAGFFAYAFYVSRKNSELQREIGELRRRLDARAESGEPPTRGDSPGR